MITLVIGQSASGKTTYVKRKFLSGECSTVVHGPTGLPYTVCGNTAVVGKYNIGKRCEGTDTLSFTAQDGIAELICSLADSGMNVVAEGDRITNDKVFGRVVMSGKYEVKIVLFSTSVSSSANRRKTTGSDPNEKFVKTTATKSRKTFEKYKAFASESLEVTT